MIDDFRGPYRWLSNFHLAPVLFEGHFYLSSEHAYQAAKAEIVGSSKLFPLGVHPSGIAARDEERSHFREPFWPSGQQDEHGNAILRIMTCAEAKRRGGSIKMRWDWEIVKLPIMTLILIDKFSRHEDLRQKLLETGEQELVEGNRWHDNFWGTCRCPKCGDRGRNNLGKVLMQIREALRLSP